MATEKIALRDQLTGYRLSFGTQILITTVWCLRHCHYGFFLFLHRSSTSILHSYRHTKELKSRSFSIVLLNCFVSAVGSWRSKTGAAEQMKLSLFQARPLYII